MIVVFVDSHSSGQITLRDRRLHGTDHQKGFEFIFFNVPQTADEDRAIAIAASYMMDEYSENPFEERCAICCGRNFSTQAFETLEAAIASTTYRIGWIEDKTLGHNVRQGYVLLVHANRLMKYDPADAWARAHDMKYYADSYAQDRRNDYNADYP